MWTIQHSVRLQCDEAPGEVVDITVTEYMDEWPGLDEWEQKVRDLGFQAMREMLAGGFLLREHALLRTWTHLDDDCQLIRRGRISVTLTSTVGKVRINRQRLFCKRCREWVTPLNGSWSCIRPGMVVLPAVSASCRACAAPSSRIVMPNRCSG